MLDQRISIRSITLFSTRLILYLDFSMRQFFICLILLIVDISSLYITGYPIVNSILVYYVYLLIKSERYIYLILPGFAFALQSLLLQDNYSYNLLFLLIMTYVIISAKHCLYKSVFLAILLITIITCLQGLTSSIRWQLPYDQGLVYTSWLISVNIGIEIAIWYIFDRGKQGNR